MNFIVFDLVLLVIFIVLASYFLYKNKKNLQKDGPFYLYRTKWGIRLINRVGKKYQKTLKILSYVSIFIGYLLMAGMTYLIIKTVYIYLTTSISSVIRVFPVAPVIPYFPKLFGLESFFPPFYFVYFIVAILIVATVHEFSHGIFARKYKIKIKSTGFAFLKYFPVFFGAFVEQDDKDMEKRSRFKQLSVLSAGVFANLIIAILFYIILFGFFSVAFAPAGVTFDAYSYSPIAIAGITVVNGFAVENPTYKEVVALLDENKTLNSVQASGIEFINIGFYLDSQEYAKLYYNAPAVNARLDSTILEMGGNQITSIESLTEELSKYSPNQEITIKTLGPEGEHVTNLILEEHPAKEDAVWLGILFEERRTSGLLGKIMNSFPSYQEPHIYYKPKVEFNLFIKDLLWWIFIINLLVALFNMLPLGALDGGRFFYLTIAGITKSEKVAKFCYKAVGYIIWVLLLALIVKWTIGFF